MIKAPARNRDERLNEVADEVYEIFKDWFNTFIREGLGSIDKVTSFNCECNECEMCQLNKAHTLITWIEEGS